jgi:hypothetical protein
MEPKREFLAALSGGASHDALLALVHRHHVRGMTPQESYRVLHQLWLELGFNDVEETSDLQDNLEYVMEKIWYECPAAGH